MTTHRDNWDFSFVFPLIITFSLTLQGISQTTHLRCRKMYVPGCGASPKAKAAKNLHNFFTYIAVFFTSEGKGWGLHTLEELPKGAFVCEFVGEILTVKELHERNIQCAQNGTYTYPILLDADWDSGDVNDKETLCLDATSYGNVARFLWTFHNLQ